ncbi:MAG: type II toxin-antitoxin system HicB family antitoxin [Pseudomonadota bacterium]
MRTYVAVVHEDENSAIGVHFPDVPGCFSAADNMDELHKNAAEALALFFEDEENLPEPRSLAAIKQSGEVDEDIAEGAMFVAVPLVRLTGRTKAANITFDVGLLQAIDFTAKERGLTRAGFLSDLARKELNVA